VPARIWIGTVMVQVLFAAIVPPANEMGVVPAVAVRLAPVQVVLAPAAI
jgi:hypothetical protein